jgi:CheY-like chemotaxis protein
MRRVYWIEDEPELLSYARDALREAVDEVCVVRDAAEALRRIGEIKSTGAVIVVDLWIPPGESQETYPLGDSAETGLFVLREIRAKLGPGWPVFVVSGNLTHAVKGRLLKDFGIPNERIFSKPLNERAEYLVSRVTEAAMTFDVN